MKTKNILLSAGAHDGQDRGCGPGALYGADPHDTKSLPMGTFVYAAPELLLGRRSDHKASSRSSHDDRLFNRHIASSASASRPLEILSHAGRPDCLYVHMAHRACSSAR